MKAYLNGFWQGFVNWASYREYDVVRIVEMPDDEGFRQDWANLAKDWENVGKDLKKAMENHPDKP